MWAVGTRQTQSCNPSFTRESHWLQQDCFCTVHSMAAWTGQEVQNKSGTSWCHLQAEGQKTNPVTWDCLYSPQSLSTILHLIPHFWGVLRKVYHREWFGLQETLKYHLFQLPLLPGAGTFSARPCCRSFQQSATWEISCSNTDQCFQDTQNQINSFGY